MKMTTRRHFYVLLMVLTTAMLSECKKDDPLQQPVEKIDPIITWDNPYDIYYGTLLSRTQLNATSNIPGQFVYTPSLNKKLAIGTNQELHVTFMPLDTKVYNEVNKTVLINVLAKKSPVITWLNPQGIEYETLLSEIQLNATANVVGEFVFSPNFGEKLFVGHNRELTLTFIPSDTNQYAKAYDTVNIDVFWHEIVFNPNLVYGTMTDQDGNTYKTIVIGTQTWMAENLRTTKYRNGDQIPNIADYNIWKSETQGAYCWMGNDEFSHKLTLGAVYNWFAVTDSRQIAPAGWHVPSHDEWVVLFNYLGGETLAGSKLKEIGTTHWNVTGVEGTNESGFTALPCGRRATGGSFIDYMGVTHYSSFWTSDPYDSWEPNPIYGQEYEISKMGTINRYRCDKTEGLFIRLVKV